MNTETNSDSTGTATLDLLAKARVGDARSEEPLRADALLASADTLFTTTDRTVESSMPRRFNPFAYTGALVGYNFILATITGLVLLIWYDASVHSAYESVQAMDDMWWGVGAIRTLHRYSSDACILFGVIHAVKVFVSRRFTGARWLAWVTGLFLIGLIWLDGWLGYWLTWDQRAQAIGAGSAEVLDVLPLFPEPIARSYLTNENINSLIFFVVFFVHVLLPIPISILTWIHLVRLKKPKFLPKRGMMIATLIVLTVLSLAVPAQLAGPAEMTHYPDGFSIDWFYLMPLFLIEHVGGVWFWVVALGTLVVLSSFPWVFARKQKVPAECNTNICNGCQQCFMDCPYEAISMVNIDTKDNLVAMVEPSRCVSCGVCIGSCDPGAMTYQDLDRHDTRKRIFGWLDEKDGPRDIVFLCANGAGKDIRYDIETGLSDELPDCRIVALPCASWLHSSFVEVISKRGGRAMLAACEESEPRGRLGVEITSARIAETREPEFRSARIPKEDFHYDEIGSGDVGRLKQTVKKFITREPIAPKLRGIAMKGLIASATVALLCGVLLLFSHFVYVPPSRPPSMLVVSFKQAGAEVSASDDVDSELGHLKGMKGRSELQPVRLRISIDGEVVHEEAFEPKGVHNDSASVGTVSLPMEPGQHDVIVEIGITDDPKEWTYREEHTVEFKKDRKRVLQYDQQQGFWWD